MISFINLKSHSKFISAFLMILILISIDFTSKSIISGMLQGSLGYVLDITSFFGFVYSWNYGISFGLFGQYYQYSNIAFIILNFFIVFYLIYILYKSNSLLQWYGYIFVIGGALGNLVDRLYNGAVFDFLYLHMNGYHFPIFNMADVFISFGVSCILYDMYKKP